MTVLSDSSNDAMSEDLYFERIREGRDSFFVEYQPPIPNNLFATLSLIFPNEVSWERVKQFQEEEVRHWLGRYPVPLMIWAFDHKEDIIRSPDRDSGCLVAWIDPESGEIVQSWNFSDLDDFLRDAPHQPNWLTIYHDVPVRTDEEVKDAARDNASKLGRQTRALKIITTLLVVVFLAGCAVFEIFGPEWLGLIGLVFVPWKALVTLLRIWNLVKPSAREQKEMEKKRMTDHYFYHCERNPEGFMRLKVENLENAARERVRKEFEDIGTKSGR